MSGLLIGTGAAVLVALVIGYHVDKRTAIKSARAEYLAGFRHQPDPPTIVNFVVKAPTRRTGPNQLFFIEGKTDKSARLMVSDRRGNLVDVKAAGE